MRKCCCPVCEAPFPFWKTLLNRGDSFRLRRTVSEFCCPTCGTWLRWSIGPWRLVENMVFLIGIVGTTWIWFFSGYPSAKLMPVCIYSYLAMSILLIVMSLCVLQPVTCDGEDLDPQ